MKDTDASEIIGQAFEHIATHAVALSCLPVDEWLDLLNKSANKLRLDNPEALAPLEKRITITRKLLEATVSFRKDIIAIKLLIDEVEAEEFRAANPTLQ